jgi:peptidoglycan endopeptidase LytF
LLLITRFKASPLWLALVASVCLLAQGSSAALAQAVTQEHTVQAGETVQSIAAAYGLSSVTLMAANALPNPDVLHVGQSLVIPPMDGVLHTVEAGDTLADIADKYQVDSADLVSANELPSADDLSVGEVLLIPGVSLAAHAVQASATQAQASVSVHEHAAPDTYLVRDGDTLRSIAEAFNLDIVSLVALNGIDNPDLIRPGSRLQVSGQPTEHVVQAAPPPPTSRPQAAAPVTSPKPAPATAPSGGQMTAMVTGYAVGAGAVSSHTASGTAAHWGTVAADTHLYPFGTRLRIEGLGDTVFVVEDTGSAVRGNVVDVWYPDPASARQLGSKTRQVTVLSSNDP